MIMAENEFGQHLHYFFFLKFEATEIFNAPMGIQICVFEKIQLEMIQIGVEFGAAAVHPPARVNLSLLLLLEETGPKLDSASSS